MGVGKACAGQRIFILSPIWVLITWIFSPVLIFGATEPTGSWMKLESSAKLARDFRKSHKMRQGVEWFSWKFSLKSWRFLPKNRSWVCLCRANQARCLPIGSKMNRKSISDVDFWRYRTDWLLNFGKRGKVTFRRPKKQFNDQIKEKTRPKGEETDAARSNSPKNGDRKCLSRAAQKRYVTWKLAIHVLLFVSGVQFRAHASDRLWI